MKNKFEELQHRVVSWRDENLESATLDGSLAHLIEEVQDLMDNPYDPNSIADIFILLMSICDYVGFSMDEVANAISSKQAVNEYRTWEEADEQGIVRYKKTNL